MIKIIPDIIGISKFFLTAEIGCLSQSMDTGVCPAGAIDIGWSTGELSCNGFQLCLYRVVCITLLLPAAVTGAVVLQDQFIVIHSNPHFR